MLRTPAAPYSRLIAPLLLAGLVAGCDSGKKEAAPAPERPVLTTTVHYKSVNQARSLAAIIKPRIESDLGFRVSGKVAKRIVQNGDRVRQGQELLLLDTNDLELQLEQAEAEVRAATSSLAQADADEKRAVTLQKDGWTPTATLDKARAAAAEARGRLTRAQRSVELARNALNYARLEADADGVITATPVEPGQVIAAGQPAVRLARLGELEAQVAIPETFVERAKGAKGSLTLWSLPEHHYQVKLRELSPTADAATRTYAARYSILDPDEAVRLGMSATLTLSEADTQGAARLPVTALFNHGRGPSVWVANEAGKLTARNVSIARYEGKTVLISSGVNEGDKVVTLGVEKIDEGLAVRPTESLSF
ncbi:efflux RND transporter periplasmic adaptor subunit [Bradyrhizobium sp.]|uniref:efflux RND transporter periplasmic adaptor subunit n=1 Tax=Bradyrhizobium sp. TaxID=376 RepID=UPI0025B945E8|nr:efflux RND transporter periplasmic adaptor subunit [Bradyrhizobium sp.]